MARNGGWAGVLILTTVMMSEVMMADVASQRMVAVQTGGRVPAFVAVSSLGTWSGAAYTVPLLTGLRNCFAGRAVQHRLWTRGVHLAIRHPRQCRHSSGRLHGAKDEGVKAIFVSPDQMALPSNTDTGSQIEFFGDMAEGIERMREVAASGKRGEMLFQSGRAVLRKCGDHAVTNPRQALQAGRQVIRLSRDCRDVISYNMMLHICAKAAKVQDRYALETAFDIMSDMVSMGIKPTIVSFNTLMNVCAKSLSRDSGNMGFERALSVLDMMRETEVQPDAVTFTTMLDACARCAAQSGGRGGFTRGWQQGIDVIKLMDDYGVEPTAETFNVLISTCVRAAGTRRAGMWAEQAVQRGMSVVNMMHERRIIPNLDTYTHLLHMCAKASEAGYTEAVAKAEKILDEARASEEQGHIKIGHETYNSMINTLAKSGHYKEALDIANDMESRGIPRSIVTWNSIMDAVANEASSGRLCGAQTSIEVLQMMLHDQVAPDVTTWNSLLRATTATAWGRGADATISQGREILQMMRGEGLEPDVITFTTLLHASIKSAGEGEHGGLDAAFDVLREMEDAGVKPNVVTFNAVLGACARSAKVQGLKMVDKGLSLIDMMGQQGVQPNRLTFNTLLFACSQAASCSQNPGAALTKGMQVITVMRSLGVTPDVISFTTLMSTGVKVAGSGDATMVSQGATLLGYMREAGVIPDPVTYSTLINMYSKAAGAGIPGDWVGESATVFEKMLEEGVRPNAATCAVLVDVCHKSARSLGGQGELELASAGGKIKRLRGLFQRLDKNEDGEISVDELQSSFVSMVTSGFTFREERISDADICRLMKECDTDRDGKISFDEFIRALTPQMTGKRLVGSGTDFSLQSFAERARRGRSFVQRGLEMLQKASKVGVQNNVVTFNALLDSCVLVAKAIAAHDGVAVREAVDECIGDALRILVHMKEEKVVPNARSYTALVNMYCVAAASQEGGWALKEGISVLKMMDEAGVKPDVVVYNSLINGAAKAAWSRSGGGVVAALEILDMMRDAEVKPDSVSYTSLINAARHDGTCQAVTLAKAVFDKMPKISRNHRTYTVMMQALIRIGRSGEALALLDEASSHGLRPNSFMYRAALQAAGENRKKRFAVESRMREEGLIL